MNTRIEGLTRTYLDSLNLSRYQLDDNQRRNIIHINNQTNWIIFNASSLRSHHSTGEDKIYDINSPYLRELLKEQIKTYHEGDWRKTFFTPDSDEYNDVIINDIEIKFFQWYRSERISTGRYDWIAAKKSAMGASFGNLMVNIKEVDLATGVGNRKVGELNNLLNDPEIQNSTAPQMNNNGQERTQPNEETEVPLPPSNENNHHDNSSHSSPSTTQTIQFKVKSVERFDVDVNFFSIELDSPITVNGQWINSIDITGRKADTAYQNGVLQTGNTVTITNIKFSPYWATINVYNELSIGKNYDEIQVVSATGAGNDTFPPQFPDNPDPQPTSFPEVQQKNQQLASEENNLFLLATEPLKTIEKIRQRKLNLKNNICQIYNGNIKKLTERKQEKNDLSAPPENELTKLKKQTIEKINKVLADSDNLRIINLTTLANGKYQDWENDIEALTAKEEVITYGNDFLTALKEMGTREKKEGKNNKLLPAISPKSLPQNNIINNNAKKIISSLPLPAAKNTAKNKIRELFKKYRPDLEKIKEVWRGEKKCDSPEKVVAFLEKIEQAIIAQRIQGQINNKNKEPTSQKYWILPLPLLISLIAVVGLVIISKESHLRKKK